MWKKIFFSASKVLKSVATCERCGRTPGSARCIPRRRPSGGDHVSTRTELTRRGPIRYFWRDCPAKNRFVWRFGLKDATGTIILALLRYPCPSVILSLSHLRLSSLRLLQHRKSCPHPIDFNRHSFPFFLLNKCIIIFNVTSHRFNLLNHCCLIALLRHNIFHTPYFNIFIFLFLYPYVGVQ